MPQSMVSGLCEELALLSPADPEYAARSVDAVLAAARRPESATSISSRPATGWN